jgi:hypothetical protein
MRPRLTQDRPSIRYTDGAVTATIGGKHLVVPGDVLALEPIAREPRRRTLFSRPD